MRDSKKATASASSSHLSYNQILFLRDSPFSRRRIPVNNETRKLAITIVAAIFAARSLTDWDGKRSPRLIAGVANAIEKAQILVSVLEARS
jgi:hypothetical protein